MSNPGELTDSELRVVDAAGSRLARAYAPSWLAAAAELEEAFGFAPEISITNGHPIGAYRTDAEQAALPGAAGAAYSDHTKGRGLDIGNQRRFRNINEPLFLEILAKHGWHNVGSSGHPFPQEPWHFANQSASPAGAGTLIPATTRRRKRTMFALLAHDGRNLIGGGLRTYLTGPGYWIETTGHPTANEVSILVQGWDPAGKVLGVPNLTYKELYDYALASGACPAEQLAALENAARSA